MYLEPVGDMTRTRRATDSTPPKVFACSTPDSNHLKCELPTIPRSWPADSNGTIRCNYGFILDGIQVSSLLYFLLSLCSSVTSVVYKYGYKFSINWNVFIIY